jgi:hypothetical protein
MGNDAKRNMAVYGAIEGINQEYVSKFAPAMKLLSSTDLIYGPIS